MSGYRVNLDVSRLRVTKGSVELFLNWYRRADGEPGTEPAFIFKRRQGATDRMAVLCLSEVHQFVGSTGYGMAAAVAAGMRYAQALGFAAFDRQAARDVTDLIVDYTEDLVRMPADPPRAYLAEQDKKAGNAELAIQVDGETVLETEIAA